MLEIKLKMGTLSVDNDKNLETLTGFASRINKKRGFLFLSKILGKHVPSKPSVMEKFHKQLADKLKLNMDVLPTLVIGFAETATGLGYAIYEQLNMPESFYIHTTRYNLTGEVLLKFQEEHCHAPSHILYKPKTPDLKHLMGKIQNIVLVDDEISTGKTAENFIVELKKIFPNVENYFVVSYLNWMRNLPPHIKYVYFHKGTFEFLPDENSFSENIVSVSENTDCLDDIMPCNFGRYGIQNMTIDFEKYIDIDECIGKKVLVIGTGEFMYPSFLIAKYLEKNGVEAYVQSTTRSPINIDCDVISKLSFKDNYYENIDNFLYNVSDKNYDKVLICYETASIPESHNLKQLLGLYFKDIEELFIETMN